MDTDITQDTTWTQAGSPFIVMASIKVFPNVTLNIEPGVVVKFNPIFSYNNNSIFVLGKLIANGTTENKIYFTSNYDDGVGGSTDDEQFCYDDIDADGNIIGEICESYDSGDPFAEDWDGIYFKDSKDSVLQNVSIRYARDAFTIESSSLNFNNLNINDTSTGVTAFNDSQIQILSGVFENINKDALVMFNKSSFIAKDVSISNILGEAVVIFNDSSLTADNLNIENIFSDRTDVVALFNHSSLSLKNSYFKDCPNEACITFFDGNNYISKPSSVNIENTVFDGGLGSGLLTFGYSEIATNIKNSSFKNFAYHAIENYSAFAIDAKDNFWGDPSGPYHVTLNPEGLGTSVFGNVLFDPWMASDPFEVCTIDCFSNVLFFPGLMGSKLYEKGLDCGGDLTGSECGDKGLWLSTNDFLQEKLSLNEEGKSIQDDIFTKNDTQKLDGDDMETGIIDEMFGLNTYKSFLSDLKDWKQEGAIKDYAFIPYDWRFSLENIITNGSVDADNNLSYDTTQNFSESFILKKLEALQKSSKSGKVTIIAHSNGGLVTKALVQKLKDTNNPIYDKIDKIIFVAVPQVGTPNAFINLLHGTDLGPGGFIMSNERSRQLAENMPTVYNLLPSFGYFTMAQIPFAPDKLITFENKHLFDPQISKYGLDISDETELKDYILGGDDRTKPTFEDTAHPNIGNSVLYNQAQSVHQILDNWQPSPDTKVIQVAGWGEETFAGFSYKSYLDFWGNEKISYKPKLIVDGDGTVVEPSALWMSTTLPNVERWWVNLDKYNKNNTPDRIHRDILEVSNLLSFIKSKITNSIFID
ncbi:alpha/beta hydrolase, partial [Candidatus Nomurabacteria bacterium]|nr:alpha/beta hydrolase [Candidatus Nomurabacteria bacterium]